VPLAVVADADVDELEADAVEALELDFEPPQALTVTAMTNRQAAIAASLRVRIAWLILALLA
jgi:hypothetical protein